MPGFSKWMLFLAAGKQVASCSPTVKKGVDWSLPDDVQLSADCLVFTMGGTSILSDNSSINEVVNAIGNTLYWSELQPTSDSFDWSTLNATLVFAEEYSKQVVARLKCSVVDRVTQYSGDSHAPFIPQWAVDECNPSILRVDGTAQSSQYIDVAAPWNECVQQKYELFVDALVANGWLEHSRLRSLYIHGISTSAGEECWLDSAAKNVCEANGLTPQIWNQTWSRRLKAWANAVDAHYSDASTKKQILAKLTWVGTGWVGSSDYNEVCADIDALAENLGMGYRSGGDEDFLHPFKKPIRGQRSPEHVTWNETTGVSGLDETAPQFLNDAIVGTEIEQFSDDSNGWYDFRNSLFVDSMIRCNAVWIKDSESFVAHNLEQLRYYRKTCDSRKQRADAIIWLRENDVRNYATGLCVALRNWGIGLQQSNAASTPRTEKVTRDSSAQDCDGLNEDWSARRTDVGQGVDAFQLQLVAQGIGGSVAADENVCVKVTFLEESGGVSLALRSADGAVIDDLHTSGAHDGDWLTATFQTNMAELTKSFEVATSNDQIDLTVKYVRVVRHCGNGTVTTSAASALATRICGLFLTLSLLLWH